MELGEQPIREECIEQAYFFRVLRERVESEMAAQEVLAAVSEELLNSTRMPMAVQFLATELKHTGSLAKGFQKLAHYFTPFQRFVMKQSEDDHRKLTFSVALLILEREATYKAESPTAPGLFIYQFEAITRNKLGYEDGLNAMAEEPFFNTEWRANASMIRRQIGMVEFSELVYLRSETYIQDMQRHNPEFVPSLQPLFSEKEGKIAKASRGHDPFYFFAALQRQLNYPEVPRPKRKDDTRLLLDQLEVKFRDMDVRLRMLEAESRGTFDPTQFGKPDMFRDIKDD
jgi:hypothetical protein